MFALGTDPDKISGTINNKLVSAGLKHICDSISLCLLGLQDLKEVHLVRQLCDSKGNIMSKRHQVTLQICTNVCCYEQLFTS